MNVEEITTRYRRRAELFEQTVAGVDRASWDNPSPCSEWTARDVVGHIIDMHAVMVRPAGRELSPAPALADDPLGAFRAARADVEAVLADADLAASECDTPMGRMSIAQHIGDVMSADLVLHRWDLARAVGADDTIDPDEVTRMWPEIEQTPEEMRIPDHFGPGIVVFGPEFPVPGDAPLQERLLGKIGRDPHWSSAGF